MTSQLIERVGAEKRKTGRFATPSATDQTQPVGTRLRSDTALQSATNARQQKYRPARYRGTKRPFKTN